MRNVINKVFDKRVYVGVLLCLYILGTLIFFDKLLLEINKFLILWGALVFAVDFFSKRTFLNTDTSVFLALFLLSSSVTVVLNIFAHGHGVLTVFITNIILLMVVYSVFSGLDLQKFKTQLAFYLRIIVMLSGTIALISLILYFCSVSIVWNEYTIGARAGRLVGIASVDGSLAVLAFASFLSSFVLLPLSSTKRGRVFTISNIFVQFAVMTLNDSRGVLLASAVVMFVWALFRIYGWLEAKTPKRKTTIVASVLGAIFIVVFMQSYGAALVRLGSYVVQQPVTRDYTAIMETVKAPPAAIIVPDSNDTNPGELSNQEAKSQKTNKDEQIAIQMYNTFVENENLFLLNTYSTERILIWSTVVSQMRDNFLFGRGNVGSPVMLTYNQVMTTISPHNELMMVLQVTGLVGLLLIVFFMSILFMRLITLLYRRTVLPQVDWSVTVSLLATFCGIIVAGMLSGERLFWLELQSVSTWVILAAISAYLSIFYQKQKLTMAYYLQPILTFFDKVVQRFVNKQQAN